MENNKINRAYSAILIGYRFSSSVARNKSAQQKLGASKRLPVMDEFRNWLYSEETEKMFKERVTIT